MSDKTPVDPAVSAVMREMGRKGGNASKGAFLKGLKQLSPKKFAAHQRKAAAARWGKNRKTPNSNKPQGK